MKKYWLSFIILSALTLSLVGCGGSSEAGGEEESGSSIEGVVNRYVKALNIEDTDLLLTTIHPFSSQHVSLRGYYDNDFAQYDYEVKKVSATVTEESETSAVVELVISKKLVAEKEEGKNELTEGEITQKLTFKTKGEEWVIDKVE
jgi:hypothetical protein